MLTTSTFHKSFLILKEISARSKLMGWFQYVGASPSLILSLGNVHWWILLRCFATIALMFLNTECVATSISRWLGGKADYYLLSSSTHSWIRGGYTASPFYVVAAEMYGSPHDEIIELKVRRVCKPWTYDNFEPDMIWEVPILNFWYATVTKINYEVYGTRHKKKIPDSSCLRSER